ncbi:FecR domain-containing protein [Pseudomonas putida]|uniref:FecR domain-containing protein n=1 Tax=Pseudomonas putida TaxID=303 RepID=UPI0004248ED2|nr:FecR domain-containing protein [Pseudomonas putida]
MTARIAPAIAEQAVEWMIELQAPSVSAGTVEQWQRWLHQHPEHARAWQRVESFAERLSGLANHAPIAHAALTATPTSNLDRRSALKVLVLAVASGTLAWNGRNTALWQNLNADYHSGVGEQRNVVLADGSQLLLNTDSAVDVRFDQAGRDLRLLRGEIQVNVVAAPALRPFRAQTGQGWVEAAQGRFLLRQESGYSRLAVRDGVVRLYPERLAGISVQAGQQLMFTRDQVGPLRTLSEADRAWTDGMLMASDMPLEQFLQELGRYRRGHLGCARSLAGVRVAGTYPLADTDRILQTLGVSLGAEVRRFTPYWLTLEPKNIQV